MNGLATRTFVIENHDEAFYLWADHGMRGRTVVHVDAHVDYFPAHARTSAPTSTTPTGAV